MMFQLNWSLYNRVCPAPFGLRHSDYTLECPMPSSWPHSLIGSPTLMPGSACQRTFITIFMVIHYDMPTFNNTTYCCACKWICFAISLWVLRFKPFDIQLSRDLTNNSFGQANCQLTIWTFGQFIYSSHTRKKQKGGNYQLAIDTKSGWSL